MASIYLHKEHSMNNLPQCQDRYDLLHSQKNLDSR